MNRPEGTRGRRSTTPCSHGSTHCPSPSASRCYDIKAQQLLDVCRGNGLAVPEEIAVIGVDNDPVLCSLTTPPLTSVIPNTHRAGYEAAMLGFLKEQFEVRGTGAAPIRIVHQQIERERVSTMPSQFSRALTP